MANDYTGKIWTLDTATASPVIGGNGTTRNGEKVFIERMEWAPNAVDNDLIIKDGAGKVIWQVRAIYAAANHESAGLEKFDSPGWYDGFWLDTIDGGTLHVKIA